MFGDMGDTFPVHFHEMVENFVLEMVCLGIFAGDLNQKILQGIQSLVELVIPLSFLLAVLLQHPLLFPTCPIYPLASLEYLTSGHLSLASLLGFLW